MYLKNHIAYRFLTDNTLAIEFLAETYPDTIKKIIDEKQTHDITEEEFRKSKGLWELLNHKDQKAYYVSDTVIDKLSLLKIKKKESGHYDWTVFHSRLKSYQKYTFILPPTKERKGGICLRIRQCGDTIEFVWVSLQFHHGDKENGIARWVMFYVHTNSGETCEHMDHKDVTEIEELVYKMMCFVFLSENTEEILKAGEKKGTQKTGKVINILPCPITIITSKWNITSIRTEGFEVSPHFALRWTGAGRAIAKMVFIDQYEKHGYIRRAKNETL